VFGKIEPNGDESIAVMIVPDANIVYEEAEHAGQDVTPEYVERLLQEEIHKLNRKLPVFKHIRGVVVKETEFEKTTTQKIKRYLVNAEDSTR
jgi:long-chain acyl-CoA synthetase